MICKHCQGCGGHVYDDDEAVTCSICEGHGQASWLFFFRVWLWFKVHMLGEDFKHTRMGHWWWKVYLKEKHARDLVKHNTPFQLQAIHGHRLVRLRQFATHIENGYNVQSAYRIEQRLVAEAKRACEIAVRAGTVRPEGNNSGGAV